MNPDIYLYMFFIWLVDLSLLIGTLCSVTLYYFDFSGIDDLSLLICFLLMCICFGVSGSVRN